LTTVQFLITVQHVVNVEVCDTIRSIWNVARTSICWLPFLMRLMTWLCPATISGLAPPLAELLTFSAFWKSSLHVLRERFA